MAARPVLKRRLAAALSYASVPLVATSCFPQFGEYVPGGGGGASASGGGGGVVTLPDCEGGFCVAPPIGWEGPVVLTTPDGDCGGAFDVELMAGETDHVGPPVSCGCECGDAAGSVCTSATVTRFGEPECEGPYPTLEVGGCTNVAGNAVSWTAVATPVGGSCPPNDLSAKPTATWNDRKLCGLASPGACEAGVCAPVPGVGLEPRLCIYEDGDVACDAAEFPNKIVLYTDGHVDDRRCDVDCTCGEPTGTACEGFVQGFQGAGCATPQDGVLFGTCDAYVSSNGSLNLFVTGVQQGACAALPRAAIGQITGVAPVTVCCTAAFQ